MPRTTCEIIQQHQPSKQIELDLRAAIKWSEVFVENTTLLHLDMSHNNLETQEIRIMAAGLDQNHSILGIHLQGNEATVNAGGFVTAIEDMLSH